MAKTLDWGDEKPAKRSDCIGRPRPCPWVSCKHNTALNVTRDGEICIPERRLKPTDFRRVEDFVELAVARVVGGETNCELDIIDRCAGGATQAEVGDELGVTACRINQIEVPAMARLREPLALYRPGDHDDE